MNTLQPALPIVFNLSGCFIIKKSFFDTQILTQQQALTLFKDPAGDDNADADEDESGDGVAF